MLRNGVLIQCLNLICCTGLMLSLRRFGLEHIVGLLDQRYLHRFGRSVNLTLQHCIHRIMRSRVESMFALDIRLDTDKRR